MQARVMVLSNDTSSHCALSVYEVSLKNLKRFSSYRADTNCDGQTDAWGKTICLPTLKWGDIITDSQNTIRTLGQPSEQLFPKKMATQQP